jgi:hypothetical protein
MNMFAPDGLSFQYIESTSRHLATGLSFDQGYHLIACGVVSLSICWHASVYRYFFFLYCHFFREKVVFWVH